MTYQDLLDVGEVEQKRMEFVRSAINKHKGSDLYKEAKLADEYNRRENRTIMEYQKVLYDMAGRQVPDNFSANYKLRSNFLSRFVTQENQYLLGNGITWGQDGTARQLGDDFDTRVQEAGKNALLGGVSFGFWNFDHLEVFSVLEFAPLYDEENGALMAGVRFWQVDVDKPLRATLYEIDGYIDYIWRDGLGEVLHEKRPYIVRVQRSEADGEEIYDGRNYEGFPIVPLWGSPTHQSALVGLQECIDAYDLIKSGFANDLDDASQIYWIIKNAGGMDEVDMARFLQRLHVVHAANIDDGADAEAHTMEVPSESRERILDRLSKDLYRDAMALDTDTIASGAVTATQIKAAYEPLNSKTDEFEYCVLDFLYGILRLAGIDDTPTFSRSQLVNASEEITTLVQAAMYLPEDYVTRRILTLFGDVDRAEEIVDRMQAEGFQRISAGETAQDIV